MNIPGYLERRIRRPTPADAKVVAGSTPVVSFGDARRANVATLGLNPSRIEFFDRTGYELVGPSRRLASLRSLGTDDLSNAPIHLIAQILNDCNNYFQHNLYRLWFDQLESVLNGCGASYYNGAACHLDLVQWATDPTWGKLRPAAVRNRLLDADAPFLIEQLANNENIRLLLLNGMGVVRQLQRVVSVTLDERDPIFGLGHRPTRMFAGTILDRVCVIGWNTNLQSSFGVSHKLRNEITKRVSEVARGACGHIFYKV